MKKKLILPMFLLAGLIVSCGPTNSEPTVPTTSEDTVTLPSEETTSEDPSTPSVDDPSTPSVEDPSTPSVEDPSTEPSVEDPVVTPDDVELPTPNQGETTIYFLSENYFNDNGNYPTSFFSDVHSYPGVRMYTVEKNETTNQVLYAINVSLTSTSSFGFAAVDSDVNPEESVSFIDVVYDTKSVNVADLGGHNLVLIHDTEATTAKSLNVYTDTYVPGQWTYEKPELPDNPDEPGQGTVEKKRIYFMDRDWWNLDGAKTAFYYWDSTTDTPEFSWPGVTAFLKETITTDYDTTVNVYYADIDTSKYDSIIFNRVSANNPVEGALATFELRSQTKDIKLSDMGDNNMVILTSAEPVINKEGETCETMFATYEEGKWDYGHITGAYVPPAVEDITLYYRTTAWSAVNAYVWNDFGDNGWPGQPMTLVEGRTDGLYSITIKSNYDNVIFNDGAGNQTGDISLSGYTKDKPYWSGTAWAAIPNDGEVETYDDIEVFVYTTWSNVNYYVWNAAGSKANWPGEAMTKVEGYNNVYSVVVSTIYTNIIFNNGTAQTGDLNLSDWTVETPCFDVTKNKWTAIPTGEQPEEPTPDVPGEAAEKIYFISAAWWQADGATTSFYSWGGVNSTSWPGTVCTLEEILSDGRQVWSFSVDVTTLTGFIFVRTASGASAGSSAADWGAKTADLSAALLGDNNCIIMTNDIVWGNPGVKVSYHTYVPGQTNY